MTDTFRWRCEGPLSQLPPGASSTFPTQGDAESWLGQSWQELAEAGIDRVTLLDGDRVVYGPMSLAPE